MKITDFIITPCFGSYPNNAPHELIYLDKIIFTGTYKKCKKILKIINKIIEL
jgi:hypothetical protein